MRFGRVVGSVWATCKDARLHGRRMLLVEPLTSAGEPTGPPTAALDTMDAGPGDVVLFTTASEAAIPFQPGLTPTDATIVAVVERIDRASELPTGPGSAART